jgi:hypothetical protein
VDENQLLVLLVLVLLVLVLLVLQKVLAPADKEVRVDL